VWVSFAQDGALLVSDDVGGVIWRVVAPGAKPSPAIAPIPTRAIPPEPKMPDHFNVKRDENSDLTKPQ